MATIKQIRDKPVASRVKLALIKISKEKQRVSHAVKVFMELEKVWSTAKSALLDTSKAMLVKMIVSSALLVNIRMKEVEQLASYVGLVCICIYLIAVDCIDLRAEYSGVEPSE